MNIEKVTGKSVTFFIRLRLKESIVHVKKRSTSEYL